MGRDEIFGATPDGEPVRRVTISSGALTAKILTWGAIIQDLRLDSHYAPLTLGFEQFEDYLNYINYFGAVAGRHANRIREGRFSIDGVSYDIEAGHPERNGLHGGSGGYARRNWTVAESGEDFVTLSLADPDGAMGFPGALDVRCTYRIVPPGTFSVEFTATTDRPTLCNLAQHAYFNLDDGGSSSSSRHELMIAAETYLPVDERLIPTGEIISVDGTLFDFRKPRQINALAEPFHYDHNFCLRRERGRPARVAWAKGAESGVEMEVWTTEPGLQFYAGHYLTPFGVGLGGRQYAPFAGFCLEAQTWPDSPNHADFPQAILRPEDTYRQVTEFRFRKG
jgi:aldose 1-epimerase